jgi:hypothetical protein
MFIWKSRYSNSINQFWAIHGSYKSPALYFLEDFEQGGIATARKLQTEQLAMDGPGS